MKHERYAILGDIHANWEALSAVLKDAADQNIGGYVCVGDLVGYNADPARCLDKMRNLECVTVRGNHDHYCSHDESLDDFHPLAANGVDWTRRELSDEQILFLRGLKLCETVCDFMIVHSTLDMPEKWGYVYDSLQAEANFNYQTRSVCFHGHTHVPVVFRKRSRVVRGSYDQMRIELGVKYFVNVGSVGQPRDGDPRAAYVVYDLAKRNIELRRVPYDIKKAQEKVRKAHLPDRLASRLEVGK